MLTGSRCSRRSLVLRLAVCACPLVLAVPAWAAITVGGDAGQVDPVSPASWTSSTSGTKAAIGIRGGKTGNLTLDGESVLTGSANIGDENVGRPSGLVVSGLV